METCYFGTYEKDYPRNRILIEGLRKNNIGVIEIQEPVWELTGDKSGKFLNLRSLAGLFFALLVSYARLSRRFFSEEGRTVYLVGYIGQPDVLLLRFLSCLKKTTIVFNPLVSLYETLVEDRLSVKKASATAFALRLIDKLACKAADKIVLDTEEHINYFAKEFDVQREKFLKAFIGADEDVFDRSAYAPKNGTGKFRVLFYGKYIPLHGAEVIVRAARLLKPYGDIEFLLAGKGQTYPEISALAAQLNSSNIVFSPPVPYESLPSLINSSDICLGIFGSTPKAGRVVPNKAFQAMAMGKPLITRDSPAAREVFLNGETALLCAPGDPEALANCILHLKNNPAYMARIAENGYRLFLKNYTSATVCLPVADYLRATAASQGVLK